MNSGERTQLVNAIRSRDVSPEKLYALNKIIAHDGAAELVHDLVYQERAVGRNEEDAVSETMLHLEWLADLACPSACVLMVQLLPVTGDHDVWDGIGLWICHNPSKEVARQLRSIAASESDPQAKQNYKGLAEFVEDKLKGKS